MTNKLLATILLGGCCLASANADAGDIFVRADGGDSVVISNVPDSEGFSLLLAGPPAGGQESGQSAGARADSALDWKPFLVQRLRDYGPWVEEAARDTSVDVRLLHAVIAAESAYNPSALSPKGAVGMMQLMPATARRYNVGDRRDARQNILGGARYLADLLRLFDNDTNLALAAYNAGEGAVIRHGGRVPPFRETETYVSRVLGYYHRLATISF